MHLPHLRRLVAVLSPLLAAACLLGLGATARAATAAPQFVTYDATSKRVVLPTTFWASNLVAGSEITWDFTGDRPTPVLAASIARDSEVTSAIAAAISSLTSLYQPLDSDLTALAALNGAGITNLNASTAFSSGQVPIARLATGTPTGSKFIRDDGTLAIPPGGGGTGDVVGPASATDGRLALFDGATGKLLKVGTLNEGALALLNAANVFTETNTFQAGTIFGQLTITNLDLVNPLPNRAVSNATPSRVAAWGSDGRLTNEVATSGSGALARVDSPEFTGTPTVNGTNLMAAIAAGGGGGGDVYLANSNKFTGPAIWTNSFLHIQGNTTGPAPVTGEGIEIRYDSDDGTFGANGRGDIVTYDRNSSAYTDLRLIGAAIVLSPVGTPVLTATNGRVVIAGQLSVVDDAYAAGWNGVGNVPTKNAVYDEMELRAPKASPALTGTPTVNGTNLMAYIASSAGSGGGGGLTLVDASAITNVNFRSSYAFKAAVSSVTNVDWIPQPPTTASATSLTPAFSSSRGHEFTLTGNATLNAPSGVTSDMVGDTFRLVFIQDSTGGRTLSTATNYLFGSDITGLTLTTNAGARDYAVVYVRRTNVFDVIGFVRGYAQ